MVLLGELELVAPPINILKNLLYILLVLARFEVSPFFQLIYDTLYMICSLPKHLSVTLNLRLVYVYSREQTLRHYFERKLELTDSEVRRGWL